MRPGIIKYILIVIVFLIALNNYAQKYQFTTESKRALKHYKKAEKNYRSAQFDEALNNLLKATDKDQYFIEAWLLLGDVFTEKEELLSAIDAYNKAISIDSSFFPGAYYLLGNIYSELGKYNKAVRSYRSYFRFSDQNSPLKQAAGKKLVHALNASKIFNQAVQFDSHPVGEKINTSGDEYINSISADQRTIIFTRRVPIDSTNPDRGYMEKLYISNLQDSVWQPPQELSGGFNLLGTLGGLTMSKDGRFLFLVSCNNDYGYGSCDLFYSEKYGNEWGSPVNLGSTVNTKYWESTPTFSSDGKTLYFASNRPGGLGSSDIYKTIRKKDGSWSKPVNLGSPVNTPSQEIAPFIHADDKTLYYSSKGHPGMGKADLYFTRKISDRVWKKPINLGYPINTTDDEINIIIASNGKTAMMSAKKGNGDDNYDIYQFDLPDQVTAEAVTYIKGIVKDDESHLPLRAHFELIDLSTEEVRVESYSDSVDGSFLVVLPLDKNYALNVKKTGYLFYSENFTIDSTAGLLNPVIKDVYLKPVKKGEVIVMKNVFFETNKYKLKPESYPELNSLIHLLKENPSVKIEIGGHTDSVGSEDHNLVLSQNRANSVKQYLIYNGIQAGRLEVKGYGSALPVTENLTAEGRALNRRTEVRVLSVDN